jgi:hypothetical protein
MRRTSRFPMVMILSSLFLLLGAFCTSYAQEAPPRTDEDRGRTPTVIPVEPEPQRGVNVGGQTDVLHPETRQQRPPDDRRQTRPPGSQDTEPRPSSSSFPGPFSDVQSAIKVQGKDTAATRFKTPCGSPDCQGKALIIKKQSTPTPGVIKANSGQVTGSDFKGTARPRRR